MNIALARRFQERAYTHNRKGQFWLNSSMRSTDNKWHWLGRVWWMSVGFIGPRTTVLFSGKVILIILWG